MDDAGFVEQELNTLFASLEQRPCQVDPEHHATHKVTHICLAENCNKREVCGKCYLMDKHHLKLHFRYIKPLEQQKHILLSRLNQNFQRDLQESAQVLQKHYSTHWSTLISSISSTILPSLLTSLNFAASSTQSALSEWLRCPEVPYPPQPYHISSSRMPGSESSNPNISSWIDYCQQREQVETRLWDSMGKQMQRLKHRVVYDKQLVQRVKEEIEAVGQQFVHTVLEKVEQSFLGDLLGNNPSHPQSGAQPASKDNSEREALQLKFKSALSSEGAWRELDWSKMVLVEEVREVITCRGENCHRSSWDKENCPTGNSDVSRGQDRQQKFERRLPDRAGFSDTLSIDNRPKSLKFSDLVQKVYFGIWECSKGSSDSSKTTHFAEIYWRVAKITAQERVKDISQVFSQLVQRSAQFPRIGWTEARQWVTSVWSLAPGDLKYSHSASGADAATRLHSCKVVTPQLLDFAIKELIKLSQTQPFKQIVGARARSNGSETGSGIGILEFLALVTLLIFLELETNSSENSGTVELQINNLLSSLVIAGSSFNINSRFSNLGSSRAVSAESCSEMFHKLKRPSDGLVHLEDLELDTLWPEDFPAVTKMEVQSAFWRVKLEASAVGTKAAGRRLDDLSAGRVLQPPLRQLEQGLDFQEFAALFQHHTEQLAD